MDLDIARKSSIPKIIGMSSTMQALGPSQVDLS